MSALFTSAVLQGLNAIELLNDARTKPEYTPLPYSCYQIAPVVGTTVHYMEQHMHKLAKAGIVAVKRGPRGGFRVTDEQLQTVRIKYVLEALGQPIYAPEGSRASDRLQQAVYDVLDVPLSEFLSK